MEELKHYKLKTTSLIDVFVALDSLSFVSYQDPSLLIEATQVIPFQEANSDQIKLLFTLLLNLYDLEKLLLEISTILAKAV